MKPSIDDTTVYNWLDMIDLIYKTITNTVSHLTKKEREILRGDMEQFINDVMDLYGILQGITSGSSLENPNIVNMEFRVSTNELTDTDTSARIWVGITPLPVKSCNHEVSRLVFLHSLELPISLFGAGLTYVSINAQDRMIRRTVAFPF